jgi:hypothetical protein
MWTIDDQMQAFKALSWGDKLRVSRHLARGQAPADPLLATAAVELAESYPRQGRFLAAAMRWFPLISLPLFGLAAIFAAVEGDHFGLVLYGLWVVGNLAQLVLNPVTRPKNMARALEAAKRVAASGTA